MELSLTLHSPFFRCLLDYTLLSLLLYTHHHFAFDFIWEASAERHGICIMGGRLIHAHGPGMATRLYLRIHDTQWGWRPLSQVGLDKTGFN